MSGEYEYNQLEKIRNFIRMGYYDSAIKESCGIMEDVLKSIFRQALAELPFSDRSELLEAEADIGRGNKGFADFGFGQLVAAMKRCRLLEKWSRFTGKDFGLLKSISLDYIVDLRNRLTHGGAAACGENEARLVFDCLTGWLAVLGYNELDRAVEKSFEQEQPRPASPLPGQAQQEEPRSAAQRHADYLKQRTESSYHSDKASERRRLRIQSQYSEESDRDSFIYALRRMNKKEHLVGLDLGCADGYVTESRFRPEFGFDLVLGVDINQKLMDAAEDHGVFRYRWMNIEAPDFEDRMEELMDELGIEGFDLVFSALTIHHLRQPERALRKIRRFLNKGGAIILRGVDDGAQIAYGDNGLVEKIIDESIETRNISDRFHARKFYSLLRSVGFSDIKMNYVENDTVGLSADEREVMFRYYFKFRADYTKRQLDSDPENPEFQRRHEQMLEDLESLEDVFLKPEFYFMVMTITAIAIK